MDQQNAAYLSAGQQQQPAHQQPSAFNVQTAGQQSIPLLQSPPGATTNSALLAQPAQQSPAYANSNGHHRHQQQQQQAQQPSQPQSYASFGQSLAHHVVQPPPPPPPHHQPPHFAFHHTLNAQMHPSQVRLRSCTAAAYCIPHSVRSGLEWTSNAHP